MKLEQGSEKVPGDPHAFCKRCWHVFFPSKLLGFSSPATAALQRERDGVQQLQSAPSIRVARVHVSLSLFDGRVDAFLC
jgi:hypothetical protein